MTDRFGRFAALIADVTGAPWAFAAALLTVLVWAMSGPASAYSDLWLLVINTITTIVTFLMVFVIQADSNRTNRALQLKLDELLRSQRSADNALIDAEHQTADEIAAQKRTVKEAT